MAVILGTGAYPDYDETNYRDQESTMEELIERLKLIRVEEHPSSQPKAWPGIEADSLTF